VAFDLFWITPLSGAVIGYFTNWLAIKMLFRPHTAKYTFGVKWPFTPGLIPRERARLAKSFGMAIENHLLTEEALAGYLNSPETLGNIAAELDKRVAGARLDDRTLGEAIDALFPGRFSPDNVVEFLQNRLAESSADMDLSKAVEYLSSKTGLFVSADVWSAETRTPRELLPADTVINIKKAAGDALPKLADMLAGLAVSPENDARLRELTQKVIDENAGTLASIFINADKVYENIKAGLLDFFALPENRAGMTMKLWGYTDRWLDTPVGEIAARLPEELKTEFGEKASKYLSDKLGELGVYLTERAMPAFIEKSVEKILKLKISAAAEKLTGGYESARPNIYKFIAFVMRNGGAYAAGRVELAKIVEEQMNAADIREAEDVILSVCGRELTAITWMGGVLGFVIGVVPLIINLIGR